MCHCCGLLVQVGWPFLFPYERNKQDKQTDRQGGLKKYCSNLVIMATVYTKKSVGCNYEYFTSMYKKFLNSVASLPSDLVTEHLTLTLCICGN